MSVVLILDVVLNQNTQGTDPPKVSLYPSYCSPVFFKVKQVTYLVYKVQPFLKVSEEVSGLDTNLVGVQ